MMMTMMKMMRGGDELEIESMGVQHVPLGADSNDVQESFNMGGDGGEDILDILGDEFDTEEGTSAWGGLAEESFSGKEFDGKGGVGGKGGNAADALQEVSERSE